MGNGLYNLLYFKIKNTEIQKGKCRLRRIKITSILDLIIKNCNQRNVICKVIEQNKNELLVELVGNKTKRKLLLKYDRNYMIFHDEYLGFVAQLKKVKADRGVYITCGLFEENIHGNRMILGKRIILHDYAYFMKNQLGWRGKTADIFKNKKLNFYKYLPR